MKDLKSNVTKALKTLRIFPINKKNHWASITVLHQGVQEKDKFAKDLEDFLCSLGFDKKTTGIYVYKKAGRTLYVGQGVLYIRIKSHYNEAYETINEKTRGKKWIEFFNNQQNKGRLKIYIRKFEDKRGRKLIEAMLDCVFDPKFVIGVS